MIDFYGRLFRKNVNFVPSDGSGLAQGFVTSGEHCILGPNAQLVTSQRTIPIARSEHSPVIDLDVAHHYEPSSTQGHGHLYLNTTMSFEDMMKLFDVMVEVGIMQAGFRDATRERGFSAVRTPWTSK